MTSVPYFSCASAFSFFGSGAELNVECKEEEKDYLPSSRGLQAIDVLSAAKSSFIASISFCCVWFLVTFIHRNIIENLSLLKSIHTDLCSTTIRSHTC